MEFQDFPFLDGLRFHLAARIRAKIRMRCGCQRASRGFLRRNGRSGSPELGAVKLYIGKTIPLFCTVGCIGCYHAPPVRR